MPTMVEKGIYALGEPTATVLTTDGLTPGIQALYSDIPLLTKLKWLRRLDCQSMGIARHTNVLQIA